MEFEDLSETVKWEARRVAAAFWLQKWGVEESNSFHSLAEEYIGCSPRFRGVDANGAEVVWRVSSTNNHWCYIYGHLIGQESGHVEVTWSISDGSISNLTTSSTLKEFMGRGFYCLGFEGILPDFDYLPTAHEKLELRLSLPREFWPQKWLDEEKGS